MSAIHCDSTHNRITSNLVDFGSTSRPADDLVDLEENSPPTPSTCCSVFLAVLDPRVGHTMDVLSPFISVLCHSGWLYHGESRSMSWCCPSRLCVAFLAGVHLALFLALSLSPGPCFVMVWPWYASFLALTMSNCSISFFSFFKNPLVCFLCCPWNLQNLSLSFRL